MVVMLLLFWHSVGNNCEHWDDITNAIVETWSDVSTGTNTWNDVTDPSSEGWTNIDTEDDDC